MPKSPTTTTTTEPADAWGPHTTAQLIADIAARLSAMALADDMQGTVEGEDIAAAATAVRWAPCTDRADAVRTAADAVRSAADAAVASLLTDDHTADDAASAAAAADEVAAMLSAPAADRIYLRASASDGRLAPFFACVMRADKVDRDGVTGAVKSVADTPTWGVGSTPTLAHDAALASPVSAGGALRVPQAIASGIGSWRPCYADGSLIADCGTVPIFLASARRGESRPIGTIAGRHGDHDMQLLALPTAGQRKSGAATISLRLTYRAPINSSADNADYDALAEAAEFFAS